MPINPKIKQIYDTLKEGGADVGSEKEFNDYFLAKGKDGYNNRKEVFNTLKEGGADAGKSYEEFAGWLGLHAVKPKPATPQHTVQATKPTPARPVRTQPTSQQKPKDRPMTAAEKASMISNVRGIVRSTQAGMQRTTNMMTYANKKAGLHVEPVKLGQKSNVVETAKQYNPKTGKMQPRYLTEAGNEYDDKVQADMEQAAIDEQKRRELNPVQSQLEDAYSERDRLEEAASARLKELQEAYNNRPLYQRVLTEMGKAAHSDMDPAATATDPEHMGFEQDEQYMQLMSAIRKNHQTIQTLEDKKNGKMNSFWHSLGTALTNGYTFADGLPEMRDATALLNAQKHINSINRKRQTGQALTKKEKAAEAVLRNTQTDNVVQDTYGSEYGAWGRAGSGMAQSIDFMKDFLLSPGAGNIAKGIAGKVAGVGGKYLAKKAGETAVKDTAKAVARATLKATGVVVGAHAAGAVISNTTGIGRTAAKMAQLGAGTVGMDKNGNYKIENQQDLMNAFVEAEREQIGENGSEMFGEFIPGGKVLSAAGKKALSKIGLGKISNMLTSIGNKAWYKNYTNLLSKGGYSGIPGEALEEYEGMFFDALTGHADEAVQGFTDPKQQVDIWLGCATMGALLGAVPMGLHIQGYYRYKHGMNRADKVADFRFTTDKWQPLKEQIDQTDNGNMSGFVVDNILNNKELEPQEKEAAMDYVRNLTKFRGFNIAQVNNADEAASETQAESIEPQNEERRQQEADRQQAYEMGREAADMVDTEGDRSDADAVVLRMREAYNEIERVFDDDAEMRLSQLENDPWEVLNDQSLTPEQQDAVAYFVNSKAAMDGLNDAANERSDNKRDEAVRQIEQRTNKQSGMIHPATLKVDDRQVYIVSGNVAMFPDGSGVDVHHSSESVVVCDAETGEMKFISPEQIYKVDEPMDPNIELQAADEAIKAEQQVVLGNDTEAGEEIPEQAEEVANHGVVSDVQNESEVNLPQSENIQQNSTESSDNSQEEIGKGSVLSTIPTDEQGQPIYEQTDPDTAWVAILEQTEGNEEIAKKVADDMVSEMKSALRRAEKAKSKGGSTVAEKIAAEKERVNAIEQAKANLLHWHKIASTPQRLQEAKEQEAKEALFSNSSEKRLAEHQNDVPDLLPTQENNASSADKDTQTSNTKQEKEEKFKPSPKKADESLLDYAARVSEEYGHAKAMVSARGETETNPTEAQKKAGNYRKGHIKVDGFDITLENPKGSSRSGKDANGKEWSITMKHDYGYIRGTKGTDGDHIDVYLSDNPTAGNVYVVDQINQQTGAFDEHKVMYGFGSMEEAVQAYCDQYEDGWKVGKVTEVNREEFKKWVDSSTRKTKPFAEYKSINPILGANFDSQGNPVNEDGSLKIEKLSSIDEITDEDLSKPTRSVELPKLPKNVDDAIGANGKPVIIKKNIFEKNWNSHKFPFDESRSILKSALYDTYLVGQTQPSNKPMHWIAIKLDEKSPIVILEVNENKDNTEIVGWYTLDERNLERIKRQAQKNGGELVMLSPRDRVESLSTPLKSLSSAAKLPNISESAVKEKENIAETSRTRDDKAEVDTKEDADLQENLLEDEKNLLELKDFVSNTDGSKRATIDGNNFDAEALYIPLLIDGKPSNLGVVTVVSDNVLDDAMQIAVYDYSGEINEKGDIDWQKWGDLADAYNEQAVNADKTYERGDTATLGFRTVDAAIKFDEWLKSKENKTKKVVSEQKQQTTDTLKNDTEAKQLATDAVLTALNRAGIDVVETTDERAKAMIGEPTENYTITPTQYTNKKGKTSDMHLVKFNHELSKEEKAAAKAFISEPLIEGRRTPRGWYDREQGGYMVRSEEVAKQLGNMLTDETVIADEQPLTVQDYRNAASPATRNEQEKKLANTVTVEDAAIQDVEVKVYNPEQKMGDLEFNGDVSKEDFNDALKDLRSLLGVSDDEGDMGILFRDDDELTKEQRKKIKAAGLSVTQVLVDNGMVKFPDYAGKMVSLIGDKIRPWLKSFYEGVRWEPGYDRVDFTPTEEVARFDVQNFDKPSPDILKQAEMVVAEQKAAKISKQTEQEVKSERNEKRKEKGKARLSNHAEKEKPTTPDLHGFNIGDKVMYKGKEATLYDTDNGRPVLDAGLAPVVYEVTDWDKLTPVSSTTDTTPAKEEKTSTEKEKPTKKNNSKKKSVSLKREPTVGDLFGDLFSNNNLDDKDNDRSRESHNGVRIGREELPTSDKVGGRTSVQDTARDSQSKRLRPDNGSGELGTRPKHDVTKKYSNEEIEAIVSSITDVKDGQVVLTGEVTDDIRAIVRQYKSGGVAKEGRGVLDEYYTDGKIVDAVRNLLAFLLPAGRRVRVLEPSVGIGNFLSAVPMTATSKVVTFEINETAARVAKILHPNIEVNVRSFETEFIDEYGNKKPLHEAYDVVIGNPPYGAHRGVYKGLGEESNISRYEDYFVKRSLDVLNEGGVLAMVLPSSWLDRQKKSNGYELIRAYRLPSGAFAGTKVGTDIIILKKKKAATPTDLSRYFDEHPERVLGVEKERSGRFGRPEKYIEGDIDAALDAISRDNAIDVANELSLPTDNDTLNGVEMAIDEAGSKSGGKKIVEEEQKEVATSNGKSKSSTSKTSNNGIKRHLKKGGEVVSASVHFENNFSEDAVLAFKDTNYDGTIDNWQDHKAYVGYYNGVYMHDYYYTEGNIYARLEQLERDKEYIIKTHGEEQYEKQRKMLNDVLPKHKGIDEITLTPNTVFVKKIKIGDTHLVDMFETFLRNLPYSAFGSSSAWEVIGYIHNEQVYGKDKKYNQLVRERRKKIGDTLFKRFIKEELNESQRGLVENAFNREYNCTYRPDYSKVPMFSNLRKDFKGKVLKLTSVQLAGVGRSTVKGVGVLAHEVGFGKTLSGVLAMHEAMTRGNARRPLIVVPNDNIMQQWIETIEEAIPEATVNVLGNLGASYDLTDFEVKDGEFSIVTYEGLKAMSFYDDTYSTLASEFSYITDDLKAHKSARDAEKAKAKRDELKGKFKKGAKKTYNFEDFGFDYLTFDEVHNANHIVGKVKLDKSEYSDFRSQSQRTSDLGIKTWIAAQHIQKMNNGRNVLLLSATPFTNKPLEYYSILSLVANETLKRKGFYNIDEFFKTFMEADNELEISASGAPQRKTNVRRFRNNGLFQDLISEYIDIKGEEDNPTLIRPNRTNKEYKLPQNERTKVAMEAVHGMLNDSDTMLQGIGYARQVAFTPYAIGGMTSDYKAFVENSPKIDATIKLIAQNKKDAPNTGQIIYSEVCVDTFPMIREYLIKETGYKESEVRIITGATSNNERVKIQEAFNAGEVKVVIGSPAIKEGLNLQGNTTDMYILSLPWNFTQLRQIEGRGWRQGNKWKNIRINYMLTEDSIDVFMLQRLQVKQGLYNEAMKSGAETVDVSDIDTSEIKAALIKDPSTRAKITIVEEDAKLDEEKSRLESEAGFIARKTKKYLEIRTTLKRAEETLAWYVQNERRGYFFENAKRGVEEWQRKLNEERDALNERGIDIDSIEQKLEKINNDIALLESQQSSEAKSELYESLVEQYTKEREEQLAKSSHSVEDYLKERAEENASGFFEERKDLYNQLNGADPRENAFPKQAELDAALKEKKRPSTGDDTRYRDFEEVNERFNEDLAELTEENADTKIFNLGNPSSILLSAGVEDKPMKLYGNKVIKKMKKHGFALAELQDLPKAVANPIAVFDNYQREGNRSILTELRTQQGNFLVSVNIGKDADVDFNIVRSVFGKGDERVVDWINNGLATYINKEKALSFLSHQSAPIAATAANAGQGSPSYPNFSERGISEATDNVGQEDSNNLYLSALIAEAAENSELSSAAKIVKDFVNPSIGGEKSSLQGDDTRYRDFEEVNERFNRELSELTEENAQSKRLKLGQPSPMLSAAGVPDKPIILYGNKLLKKAKLHGFEVKELHNLPLVMQAPIAVFEGSHPNSFATLLEIKLGGHNTLASIEVNKKGETDFNIISSLFGKESKGVTKWILDGKLLSVDKEKAQSYISASALNADATYKNELSSAAKIVKDFVNPVMKGENLSRDGAGTLSDDELSIINDPIAKMLGKSTRTARQRKEFADRQRRNMVTRVMELAATLHLDNVKIVTDVAELSGKRARSKGFYNPQTDAITIVIPNHESVQDIEQTLLHEAVAHYGLRKLFGEHFDTFLKNVYEAADEGVRRRITDLALKKHHGNFHTATEEYLASLAENTDFERIPDTFWGKIKRLFLEMLHGIGFENWQGGELSDNELRYILWRSYENLKEPGRYRSILGTAKDVVKQSELKVGNYAENSDSDKSLAAEDLFRDGNSVEYNKAQARNLYEQRVSRGLYQMQEAIQDSMLGLKEAMEAILKAEGGYTGKIEDVAGYENPYLGENRLSSVNQAECSAFARTLFKPMLEEVAKLAKTAKERAELTDYMMAKHGLERNSVMARRAAEKVAHDEFWKALRTAERTAADDPLDQDAADVLADVKQRMQDRENELYAENRGRDYAGLTALTEKDDVADAENEARQMVSDYEADHDTTDLWNKVNAVTKATLQKNYECGIISKATYNDISDMYEHYIPLRGFDEKTSDEAYAYLSEKHSAFNAPIKTAKGRKSKADDPFANMEAMAESAIMQGNRNILVKRKFMRFAQNHPSDLVSISDLWLYYNYVADEWKPVNAGDVEGTERIEEDDTPREVERKMRDFEEKMRQLSESDPDHFKRQKDHPEIPYRVIGDRDLRQHQVLVKQDGKDYVLTINGNPRAAQALNGQTNPDNDMSGAMGAILHFGEVINRQLSAFYTTRKPDFVASNFMRDMLYANTMVWVKESPNYALRFHKNFAEVNPAKMKVLLAKLRNGTLDVNDETEKAFSLFIKNGGETGYSNIRDIEQRKNDIKRELRKYNGKLPIRKAWSLLGERLDEYNRAVENCARFAAFMTSRQMKRSIDRSVYDAKEISVNFNKKGSGAKFMRATGQTKSGNAAAFVSGLGRSSYVFWNAAIQGTTNFGRQFKYHPDKALTGAAAMFLLGALVACIAGDDGNDDSKNSYYNLPEYVRRSNVVFRLPGMEETWISIPLPVEYRALYGMGELTMGTISGKEHYTSGELASQIASQVSQALPIDFMEGDGGFKAFVPSAVKPYAEAMTNKSWTGMPIYNDTSWNKDMPEWTKAYKSANKQLVGLSKVLNEVTGGDAYTKGWADVVNPAQVEYLLNGYFGGVSSTIDKFVKMGETALGQREYDPRSFLILNRLVKSGDERTEYRHINNEYFRLKQEHDKLKARLKHYEEDTYNGVFDYAEKINWLNKSPEYQRLVIFEDYSSEIDAINKELKEPMNDNERKELEKELYELKKKLVEEANKTRK